MRSISGCLGLVGWGMLWLVSCGGSAGELFPSSAGAAGAAGLGSVGGAGGTGGAGGSGQGGSGQGGVDAGVADGGEAGGAGVCDGACDDGNDCTLDLCVDAECQHPPVEEGAACGRRTDDDCTAPDSCDGAGLCRSNDAPDGAECSDGSCTLGECIEGQPVGCPAAVVTVLPFEAEWRTVGGVDLYAGCNEDDTPDFAVVFTAPSDGTYRFDAAGLEGVDDPESGAAPELADSVLAIAEGACAGPAAQSLGCSDDVGSSLDSRLDLELDEGDTVTVYVGEYGEVVPGGGSGTLSIRRLAN